MTKNSLIAEIEQYNVEVSQPVTLPTMGKVYYDGVLADDVVDGEVEVLPLDIVSDLRFRDPILLTSGMAVPKLIAEICPSILEPDELCDIDIEAILIACRIISNGPDLKFKHTCTNPDMTGGDNPQPVCRAESDVSIDLYEHIQRYSVIDDWTDYVMPIVVGTGDKQITQMLFLRPTPYRTSIEAVRQMYQTDRMLKRISETDFDDFVVDPEQVSSYAKIVDSNTDIGLRMIIDSIFYAESASGEKVSDPDDLKAWLRKLPVPVVDSISNRINSIAANNAERAMIKYSCPACGHVNDVQVQLDPNKLFFSEPQTSPPPVKSSTSSAKKTKSGTQRLRTSSR